jgi:hypothetical protein
MPHAEIVVGPPGWNGWGVHVSRVTHALNTNLQPWSARLAPNSPEMQVFHAAYPLDGPARVTHFWNTIVVPQPPNSRSPFHAWMRESALETIRVQQHPNFMSRLDAVFGFLCFADAIRFACHHRDGAMCYLHEVQPAHGTLLADMKLWDECNWDYVNSDAAYDSLMSMATAYWQNATGNLNTQGMARPELLMPAPITVTQPRLQFERER